MLSCRVHDTTCNDEVMYVTLDLCMVTSMYSCKACNNVCNCNNLKQMRKILHLNKYYEHGGGMSLCHLYQLGEILDRCPNGCNAD